VACHAEKESNCKWNALQSRVFDDLICNKLDNEIFVNSYISTYPKYVKFFKNKPFLSDLDFVAGLGLAYSWMPLSLIRIDNNKVSDYLNGSDTIKNIINNNIDNIRISNPSRQLSVLSRINPFDF